jgi:hypothetical protein
MARTHSIEDEHSCEAALLGIWFFQQTGKEMVFRNEKKHQQPRLLFAKAFRDAKILNSFTVGKK